MKKTDFDLFKIENSIVPQQGRVLVSGPFLHDIYFSKSVILIAEHNDDGTIGFVINKPVTLNVKEILKDFPDFNANISLGGPVNTNTIQFIHNVGNIIPKSIKILDNLYWGGDFDALKDLIDDGIVNNTNIKFFIGYSGWTPNQLNEEIKENSWLVTELNDNELMKRNDNVWADTLSNLGEKYKIWTNFPDNPSFN